MEDKQPFDIHEVLARIRQAVAPLPKAAMWQLADAGYHTPFQQLVGCIISIRTLDEVTTPAALRLFAVAETPAAVARLPVEEIARLISPSTFGPRKAVQIQAMARRVAEEYGGELPCDQAIMLSFAGVGIKCANLVLGRACGQEQISVDVHVHRVTNRWGYVATAAPERTVMALEERLPRAYWVEINKLLVPFGKHICTGRLPHCSTCPVLVMCRQVGVTRHR